MRFDASAMIKILVTGGTGQVGTALGHLDWPEDVLLVMPDRAELELAEPDQLKTYVLNGNFSAVINSGAYTAVDRAEQDPLTAFKINALAPAALAEATATLGIPLLHVSTDYVFDGSKRQPYVEDDPINPICVYGASKASGELAIRSIQTKHLILRTSWVFSATGSNFVKSMLNLVDRPQLRVVADQSGCPTAAIDIARALRTIVLRMMTHPNRLVGTYHFCGGEPTTWYEFAIEIFALADRAGLKTPAVEAIESKDYPTAARRPANSVMSSERLCQTFGIEPCQWREALADTFASLRKT